MRKELIKMKAIRILSRNIRDAFKSVFRNFSLSLASISCITITLIVVALSLVLTYNVKNFTEKVEKNATVVAFLNVDITSDAEDNLRKQLEEIDNVETIDFESKTQIQEKVANFFSLLDQRIDTQSKIIEDLKKKKKGIENQYFSCNKNQLSSLEGAPRTIGGSFYCYNNPNLHSLDGLGEVKGKIYKAF